MKAKQPNLIFAFSDQQSFDMLGCAGNPQLKTPNLDAFAEQGVRFEHAVANCPVCTPCRSMLLSGRHPLHNNCFENDRRLLIGMLDMAPTMLGLMELDIPSNWQGQDLSSAILGKDDDAVDSVPIFNFKPSWRGVYPRRYTFALENIERTPDLHTRFGSDLPDRRKYTQNFNVFYDRTNDPLQLSNLINSTEHIDMAWELTQRTHEWCRIFRDPFLSYKHLTEIVGEQDENPPIDRIGI